MAHLSVNINYHQILKLVQQLPEADVKKLIGTLQSRIKSKKSPKSLQDLLLEGPTWTDEDFERYQQARDHINKSRLA